MAVKEKTSNILHNAKQFEDVNTDSSKRKKAPHIRQLRKHRVGKGLASRLNRVTLRNGKTMKTLRQALISLKLGGTQRRAFAVQ